MYITQYLNIYCIIFSDNVQPKVNKQNRKAENAMKDYIKPTIEILENQIEKSIADTGRSDKKSVHKLAFIHTLSQNQINNTVNSTDDS